MTQTFSPSEGERHPYLGHLARVLDRAIVESGLKATWIALSLGISETLLSDYRSGKKPIPLYRTPLIDELLGQRVLLEALAAIEGSGVHELTPIPMSADDLERLFPLILREEGTTNADVFEALKDGQLNGNERERLHAHFAKLRHFFQDCEERTASQIAKLRRAE